MAVSRARPDLRLNWDYFVLFGIIIGQIVCNGETGSMWWKLAFQRKVIEIFWPYKMTCRLSAVIFKQYRALSISMVLTTSIYIDERRRLLLVPHVVFATLNKKKGWSYWMFIKMLFFPYGRHYEYPLILMIQNNVSQPKRTQGEGSHLFSFNYYDLFSGQIVCNKRVACGQSLHFCERSSRFARLT